MGLGCQSTLIRNVFIHLRTDNNVEGVIGKWKCGSRRAKQRNPIQNGGSSLKRHPQPSLIHIHSDSAPKIRRQRLGDAARCATKIEQTQVTRVADNSGQG